MQFITIENVTDYYRKNYCQIFKKYIFCTIESTNKRRNNEDTKTECKSINYERYFNQSRAQNNMYTTQE